MVFGSINKISVTHVGLGHRVATGMAIDIAFIAYPSIDSTLPITLCPSPPSSPNMSVNSCVLTIKPLVAGPIRLGLLFTN
jgi:hypothetical protein